jgi:hypothetical protein
MNAKLDMMDFYKFIQDKRESLKSSSFDSNYLGSEFGLHINNSNLNVEERNTLKVEFFKLMGVLDHHPELRLTEAQFKLWLYETELYNLLNVDRNIIADILRERSETISLLGLAESFLN